MSIFQKSVINKYLKNLDKAKLDKAFGNYKDTFTSEKIEIIRSVKEEEYQDGFLRDLFVNSLGYKLNIDSKEHDLVREKKNQTDAKKADGAIIKDGKVTAVIELKDTKTKDMGSFTEQAFGYKNSQDSCKYVITSNFHKLRFYIDNKVDFEEFNLFELGRDDFELLYLILNKESIFNDIPAKLKEETKFHEETVSNKLYSDYSSFKKNLFSDMTNNNPQYDKLTLFKKSQKLLDRFLFILFAEDRGLLPPNSTARMITRFDVLKSEDSYKPLYDICRQYFGYMNTGNQKENIPAYNGGLFLPDDILDSLKIEDGILRNHLWKLSIYDFATEIDVNILGHIFEHSLSEIEEISAEIEGIKTDKAKSKRKKDGVYYTPKYITQYIVEHTVGTLCREKRKELGIETIEFDEKAYRKANGFLTEKGRELFNKLEAYKVLLFSLKILDPACGSGAFLIQALNFLIQEHKTIDDIIAELTGSPLRLFDTDKAILENNLYGVDINDESVEIAKLSLWLHTARKDRKLSDLNNNIKCGNSLIDDPKVAGDKAFDWHKEFRDIMQAGGFDVVIGNPPYVRAETIPDVEKKFYSKNYYTAFKQYDLYILFYEIGLEILKPYGILSYISPNKFFIADYGKMCRKFILENSSILNISDVSMMNVFEDASVYPTIITLKKEINKSNIIDIKPNILSVSDLFQTESKKISQMDYLNSDDHLINLNVINRFLVNKVANQGQAIKSLFKISRGFRPPKDDLITDNKSETTFPYIIGSALSKAYNVNWDGKCVKYDTKEIYEAKPLATFLQPKIFIRDIGLKFNAYFDNSNYLCLKTIYFIHGAEEAVLKYVTALLNSRLINFYFYEKFSSMHISGGYLRFRKQFIEQVPVKMMNDIQPFVDKVNIMLDLNKQLQDRKNKFQSRIKSNFALEKISTKLESFHDHDYKTFVAELKKQKVSPTLKQQDEWEEYFNSYKKEINDLQAEIKKTDAEIDQMVYKLYELTDEEIRIVEGSV